MAPDRVVAGAVRQDGIVGEAFAQVFHHVADVEIAGAALMAQARNKVRVSRLDPGSSVGAVDRLEQTRRGEELHGPAADRKVGLEAAPKLLGIAMDAGEGLWRA